MTPQERPEPGRTRREGNIRYIQTEFATRVRSAVISLAKREAREAVKRKLRAEGHRPHSRTLPKSTGWQTPTSRPTPLNCWRKRRHPARCRC